MSLGADLRSQHGHLGDVLRPRVVGPGEQERVEGVEAEVGQDERPEEGRRHHPMAAQDAEAVHVLAHRRDQEEQHQLSNL